MAENLTTKQFVDIETGLPVSNPVYIGDVYDAEGGDAVLRLFGQEPLTWRCSSWSSEFCCRWWSWCCRRH